MLLDLNCPESILAWWRACPERHDPFLEQKVRTSPEFALAIRVAQRRIAASEELQRLLAASVDQRRRQEAYQAQRREAMSSVELLRRDLAAA